MTRKRRDYFYTTLSFGVLLTLFLWISPLYFHEVQGEDGGAIPERSFIGESRFWFWIDPTTVVSQRQDFQHTLQKTPVHHRRALYEQNLGVIGVNGILEGIETLWPHCHSEAHDLGKVIYSQVRDITHGVVLCDERCHSGCMHGVLMEAITTKGWTESSGFALDVLRPLVSPTCSTNLLVTTAYSPGDCAHGVGHALTVVAKYRIQDALGGCGLFENEKAEYYCATGVYMEYVNTMDEEDIKNRSFFYPCDSYEFSSACARYKMVHILRRHYLAGMGLDGLKEQCKNFPIGLRLGCFHGLGNAHVPYLARGFFPLKQVCDGLAKNEEIVCIDGAIERLAKYQEPRALEVCEEFYEKGTTHCLSAVKYKMYNMEKDLTLYLSK